MKNLQLHLNICSLAAMTGRWLPVMAGLGMCLGASSAHADLNLGANYPKWYPYENAAISLYASGMAAEDSNPQTALDTLLKAQKFSRAAISSGGGGNAIVRSNDRLISRAVFGAQQLVDHPKSDEKQPEPVKKSKPSKPSYSGTGISHIRTNLQAPNTTGTPGRTHD